MLFKFIRHSPFKDWTYLRFGNPVWSQGSPVAQSLWHAASPSSLSRRNFAFGRVISVLGPLPLSLGWCLVGGLRRSKQTLLSTVKIVLPFWRNLFWCVQGVRHAQVADFEEGFSVVILSVDLARSHDILPGFATSWRSCASANLFSLSRQKSFLRVNFSDFQLSTFLLTLVIATLVGYGMVTLWINFTY